METCVTVRNEHIKRAGKYLLGLPLPKNSLKALTSWIAREDGTYNFRVLRILNLVENSEVTGEEILKGKIVLQRELFLLRLLEGEPGIMRHHGMFREKYVGDDAKEYSRIISVVDCFVPHDFSPEFSSYTNLYMYMRDLKRISEEEAIRLFVQCLRILSRVHEMNVVHRDLTLSNFVLNKQTGQLYLVNFGLGNLLLHENELLPVQPGSPLYFSPDIITARPYLGKPTDMWSMGVIFFGLLFSEFPFYAKELPGLYKKISSMSYDFPKAKSASARSVSIIKGIFKRNPKERLTCNQVLDELLKVPFITDPSLQVVPCAKEEEEEPSNNYPTAPKVPPTTRKFPLSYDSHGEIRLKFAEVVKFHRQMFSQQNTTISAHS